MTSTEHLETLSSDQLRDLLPRVRESDPREAITILKLISDRAHQDQDYEALLHWKGEIFKLAQNLGDSQEIADSLYSQGFALTFLDRDAEATNLYLGAKKIYEDLLSTEDILYTIYALVNNSKYLSDNTARLNYCLEGLNLARINEDVKAIGDFALQAAESFEEIGQIPLEDLTDESYEIALSYAEEAFQNFLNLGDASKIIESLCGVTHYLNVLQKYESAFEIIKEAESRIPDLEDAPESNNIIIGRIYKFKGILQMKLGRPSEAIEDFKQSLKHLSDDEEIYDLGVVYWKLADLLNDLGKNEDALDTVTKGMKVTRHSNPLMYYRCMQLQVQILYEENREREALFISRGAMLEYEDSGGKAMQPHIYFSLILNAALCLLEFKRYEEILQVLSKTRSIDDYLIPVNRAVRVDYLMATAHVYLGNTESAKETLDALLDYDDLDMGDEDIGAAFILRSIILSQSDKTRAQQDLERGTKILKYLGLNDYLARFIEEFPQLKQNLSLE